MSTRILVVSANLGDWAAAQDVLRGCSVECRQTIESAVTDDATETVSVVLCERDLPDGTWRDLLGRCGAPVIVFSHAADDELWIEVLDRGGFDLLPAPFDASELRRVCAAAAQPARTLAAHQ